MGCAQLTRLRAIVRYVVRAIVRRGLDADLGCRWPKEDGAE
jgi:hypothetical protein